MFKGFGCGLPVGTLSQSLGSLDQLLLDFENLIAVLSSFLGELTAVTEECIYTRTEALVDHVVILAWSIADGTPFGLHFLDLLCGFHPSIVRSKCAV